MSIFTRIIGDNNSKSLKPLYPIVERINALESTLQVLSDNELKAKTDSLKARLKEGENLDEILPEAFALVREASKRTLKQRHFDAQLLGGMVLHQGGGAEMRTGEGKTLVATLPAFLNALEGRGVHIVTVNDYLSRRDAVWMGQIYSLLGLSVGVINHEESFLYDPNHIDLDAERDALGSFHVVHDFLRRCSRKEAYDADITYGTNNEFGFDYLRDNIEYDKSRLRQREYNYAIVDEVDSILIDEARTPLIISAPTNDSEDLYSVFTKIARDLVQEEDYTVDEKLKAISITEKGINKAEKLLGVENIYTEKGIKYVHHLETAVRAKALFNLDKDYVVKNDEVIIVDEFTGRLQPGRRWSEGLHQAIEAKEGVKIQKESRTFASITFQNYFRLYKKLSGMTGTALTSKEEFYKVYGLNIVAIPTNKKPLRIDHDDFIFQTEHGKFIAVARKIKELNKKGQPVLIGTVSIEKNELLSAYLKKEGIVHQLLNAKNHEKEGEIISQAGRKGAVTIATNMAGRGVDIKLGGNPSTEEENRAVEALGGLFVIGTERHEARRIDNQLRGRSGRQGDRGETQFFVSLEDSLMRIFASDTIKKLMGRIGIAEDEPIQNGLITRSLESAQTKIEGHNFDARKHILQFDDVMNLQRKIVYERRRKILVGGSQDVYDYIDEIVAEGGDESVKKIVDEKRKLIGEERFATALQRVVLQTVDMFWVEHLEMMDYMRGSVNLRAYGQRDPLVEYKKEGLHLFKEMEDAIKAEILKLIPNLEGEVFIPREGSFKEIHESASVIGSSDSTSNDTGSMAGSQERGESVGRNEPCPCGSGKKYKHCGLVNTKDHQDRTKNIA
jgi:preprotein translocase subunit SecA